MSEHTGPCNLSNTLSSNRVGCSSQHGDAVAAVRELTMIPATHGDVARCVASSSNLHPALAPLLGAVVAAAGHGLASQVGKHHRQVHCCPDKLPGCCSNMSRQWIYRMGHAELELPMSQTSLGHP